MVAPNKKAARMATRTAFEIKLLAANFIAACARWASANPELSIPFAVLTVAMFGGALK